MKQYQDQRMKQMVSVAQSRFLTAASSFLVPLVSSLLISCCRPTYGTLQKIHVLEYVDLIDKSPKDVPVIIHLYQEV